MALTLPDEKCSDHFDRFDRFVFSNGQYGQYGHVKFLFYPPILADPNKIYPPILADPKCQSATSIFYMRQLRFLRLPEPIVPKSHYHVTSAKSQNLIVSLQIFIIH